MKGLKTYRHNDNPKEKELHDKFIKDFVEPNGAIALEQIAMPIDGNGNPTEYLTERQAEIMITTIQWLGSPVGQNFLRSCGFELKK